MLPSIKTPNGYLPGPVRTAANNLLAKGLCSSFPWGKGVVPFKVCIVRRVAGVGPDLSAFGYPPVILMPDCQLRGDNEASPYFLGRFGAWSPLEISQLADTPYNRAILADCDIYWMAERDPNE